MRNDFQEKKRQPVENFFDKYFFKLFLQNFL